MAYTNYYNQQNQQVPLQFQNHLFPQPNGNVYTINSSSELSNIPVGIGLTVVLCMAENTLYLKTIQNGNPVVWSYRISSSEENQQQNEKPSDLNAGAPIITQEQVDKIEQRIAKLEKRWGDMFDEYAKS